MAKKKKFVPIRSMGDFVDLFNNNSAHFDQEIEKLVKSNRKLKTLCLLSIVFTIYAAVEYRKQEDQIYQLSVRMKKLERDEGE